MDLTLYAAGAVAAQPLRAGLTALGIAVGVAAVILLTAIGEGVHRYVLAEFTQFGTNLLAITPGKTQTFGVSGAMVSTTRPLSLEDAAALARLDGITAAVPVIQGNASVEFGERGRRTTVLGVNHQVPAVWQLRVRMGRFLPADDTGHPRAYAVLGAKLHRELFGDHNPLGQRIRVGGERYRIVGVMAPKGQLLGFDLDDTIYLPVAKVMAMFDREGLMEVDLLYRPEMASEAVAAAVRSTLMRRHGHEDFTITTQDQMLEVLGSILGILTLAVGALGGISLLVGGVGILTIMTISVHERTAEIGLLRALGARPNQILALFLAESAALSAAGGLAGLMAGTGLARGLAVLVPKLPVHVAWEYLILAAALAVVIGLAAGVAPAARASRTPPVEALRSE